LLEKAILANIDPFTAQLQSHFDDMFKNGREIMLTVKKWNSWDKNMETEIDEKEITDYINKWMKDNTVNKRFTMADATENVIRFDQVRIPLYNSDNDPIDARQFAKGLQKYLKAAPFNFEVKLMTRGLGEAILVLGEK
jgi:Mg2+/Co2+ transporter CorC